MKQLSQDALDQILVKARSQNGWLDKPVSDEALKQIYDLTKWGPTSANTCPLRIVFVRSGPAKEKLLAGVSEGNLAKVKAAPVTAILAEDKEFYEKLPKLFPQKDVRSWFAGNQALIDSTAFRNSTLQGAYFMIAARAVGLDVGPMSGFDNAKIDEAFFKGTSWKSNFICSLGHGDPAKVFPRLPRLEFEEACKIL